MITEDQLEQLCLEWFKTIGYDYVCGYDIAPDGEAPERSDYRQIILQERLLNALQAINPQIPLATLEQVTAQLALAETPVLIKRDLSITITLTNTALKNGLKCSFTVSKLRFCALFCLVLASLMTLC